MMQFRIIPIGFRQRIILGFSCLILLFLGIMVTVELVGIPGTALHGSFARFRTIALNDMELVSGLLKQRATDWFTERRANVALLSRSPFLCQAIAAKTPGSDLDLSREMNVFLESHTEFESIAIIDPQDASIRAASGYFEKALLTPDVFISLDDLSLLTLPGYLEKIDMRTPSDQKNRLRIIRQVISADKPDKIIAVLIAEININNTLLPKVLSVSSQFSRKWKCVLAGNAGAILTDSHDKQTVDSHPHEPLSTLNAFPPIRMALGGLEGAYDGPDQFGQPVLAFHRQVKFDRGIALALILKMDRMLVLQPVWTFIFSQIVLWLAMLVVGIAACLIIARQISQPLQKLVAVARRVESGDLTARATEISSSETGLLASVFNSMVDRLHTWHQDLELLVLGRTRELKESEAKYRLIFENAIEGIFQSTSAGRFISASPSLARIYGYDSPEDLIQSVQDIGKEIYAHPEDRARFIEQLNHSDLLTGFEFQFRRKDGSTGWASVSARPVRNERSDLLCLDGFVIDITERKKAEEEKLRLESMLMQAQKMESIGSLAGGIAHDLNNILFPISGLSEMLLDGMPPDSPEHDSIEQIHQSAQRGSDLVKQILAFSRQSNPKKLPIRIQPILKEVLKLARATIPMNIEITSHIKPDCGLVSADPTQVHQIIMNLITNAYHAVEQYGGTIHVELKETAFEKDALPFHAIPGGLVAGRYACITVSDTGTGMDRTLIDKIFTPYFTTKELGKGTGLGLSVVHGIVKEHGGDIRVYSEIGKGTAFHVYLPLLENAGDRKTAAVIRMHPAGHERILLVDDEEPIVRMEQIMLERLGYQVTVRTSSLDALDAFRCDPSKFDLVISDRGMPNLTGEQLAGELIAIRSEIPIILCTGFSDENDERRARAMGIKGFLMKPVATGDLAAVVRRALDGDADSVRVHVCPDPSFDEMGFRLS